MRIGLILFSDGWGGAENVVHELAKAFQAKEEEVTLILNQEIVRFFEDLPGVRIFSVGPLHNTYHMAKFLVGLNSTIPKGHVPGKGFMEPGLKNALRVLRHRSLRDAVRKILIEERIDLVSLHLEDTFHLYPTIIAPLSIPTAITLHSPFIGVPRSGSLNPIKARRRHTLIRALGGVDGLTYQSDVELNSMGFLPKPPRFRSVNIPNGADVGLLRQMAGKVLVGERTRLVYLGGSRWQKGGPLAVKTMALLKEDGDAELHMLGHIPEGHEIRRLTMELGLEDRITFHGFIPSPGVFDYLNSADIVIIPSVSEGFSVTAIEAMALGKPIVATKVGGIPTAVKDGRNALLVAPDPGELARAVRHLISDGERRETMARTNWEDAKRYDWKLISEQYLNFFNELIQHAPSSFVDNNRMGRPNDP